MPNHLLVGSSGCRLHVPIHYLLGATLNLNRLYCPLSLTLGHDMDIAQSLLCTALATALGLV
jgi:hypothetical protein